MKEESLPSSSSSSPDLALQPGPAVLLCDTGRVALLHQPADGKAAIVTFAPRQERKAIWGGSFLTRFGADQFGLVDYGATWFPQEDMERVIPVLAPLLAAYDQVVLYGFSMGAYAALKYSAQLRADTVLAFSPQYSIAPADVGDFDRRRSGVFFQPDLHRDMRITAEDLGGHCLAFYDPLFPEDVRHAALIRAQAPLGVVLAPFAQHESARFMISAGRVEPMLRRALAGEPLPAAVLRAEFRAKRLLSPDYVLILSELLARRWGQDAAIRLLQKALEAGCIGPAPRIALAHHLLDRGEADAAAALVDALKLSALRPSQRPPLLEAWRRLRLHAGEDSLEPDLFPADDTLWTEVATFLTERLLPEDRILAPLAFRKALPPFDTYADCGPAAAYDWVVLHKDSMARLGARQLAELASRSTPVFANTAFIVWALHPSFGLVDLRDVPEVTAVTRDLTGGWALVEG